jgi:hypothetical protein
LARRRFGRRLSAIDDKQVHIYTFLILSGHLFLKIFLIIFKFRNHQNYLMQFFFFVML